MSLKCCNRVCQTVQTIELYDTCLQTHRLLIVGRCKNPKCGCLKAEFLYYDVTKGKFIHQAVPREKVREVIQQYKKMPYLLVLPPSIKNGTYNNMQWKYHKNGCIYDFNNTLIAKLITNKSSTITSQPLAVKGVL